MKNHLGASYKSNICSFFLCFSSNYMEQALHKYRIILNRIEITVLLVLETKSEFKGQFSSPFETSVHLKG